MRKNLGSALVLLLGIISNGGTMAQAQTPEQKIWTLLDDPEAAYVSLGEAEFRALGAGFDLPDGGRSITRLAEQTPGGAFDPRDVAKLPPQQLGYKADWVVERFRRYNLEWDIAGLRLESLDPEAKNYPWFIVMNGGAANFYEFFVDLKNRPGWTQYLAQKLNVKIVTSRAISNMAAGNNRSPTPSASPRICSTATFQWMNTKCATPSTPTASSCRGSRRW